MENTSVLAFVIFVAVFAGVVLVHEFGHFIVARLFKIEVEEFGVGLPPRAFVLGRGKGHLFLKSGKRVEIPRDFGLPFPWSALADRELTLTVDATDDTLVLRSLEFSESEKEKKSPSDPMRAEQIHVDQNGKGIQPSAPDQPPVKKRIKIGKGRGEIQLVDFITESHPGTEFTLNWLPLGGFVRPKGENDPTVRGGLAAANPWARFAVLIAGASMNLLAGVLVYSLIFTQIGIPDYKTVKLYEVMPDSPAEQGGLRVDDVILSADGETITSTDQFRASIRAHIDQPFEVVVLRAGERLTFTVMPLSSRSAEQGALGILPGPAFAQPSTWFATLPISVEATYQTAYQVMSLPAQLIRGILPAEQGRLIGLKGIYDVFQQAVGRDVESRVPQGDAAPVQPTNFTLELIASLTISIGIFNLLPFPALDGGRIVFLLPELIFRRRVSARVENIVHAAGMLILLGLMLYVNVMDFVNPLQINLP